MIKESSRPCRFQWFSTKRSVGQGVQQEFKSTWNTRIDQGVWCQRKQSSPIGSSIAKTKRNKSSSPKTEGARAGRTKPPANNWSTKLLKFPPQERVEETKLQVLEYPEKHLAGAKKEEGVGTIHHSQSQSRSRPLPLRFSYKLLSLQRETTILIVTVKALAAPPKLRQQQCLRLLLTQPQ